MNKISLLQWWPCFGVAEPGCFEPYPSVIYLCVDCVKWKAISYAVCFSGNEHIIYNKSLLSKDSLLAYGAWQAVNEMKSGRGNIGNGFKLGLDIDNPSFYKQNWRAPRNGLHEYCQVLMRGVYDISDYEVGFMLDPYCIPSDVLVRRLDLAIVKANDYFTKKLAVNLF